MRNSNNRWDLAYQTSVPPTSKHNLSAYFMLTANKLRTHCLPTCCRLRTSINLLILVINQLDAHNLFYNKSVSCLYVFRAPCAHRQEVKIVLYSLWYHHTETSEWSKVTKITKITKIYKYEHIVVKFMCEFSGVITAYYLL
jgi:hypothetical protein